MSQESSLARGSPKGNFGPVSGCAQVHPARSGHPAADRLADDRGDGGLSYRALAQLWADIERLA